MLVLSRFSRLFGKKDLDCVDVRNLSSDYLEGELPQSRLQKFRDHLSGCPPCQTFVDGLASMVGMLSKLPSIQAPQSLKESILEQTREQGDSKADRG